MLRLSFLRFHPHSSPFTAARALQSLLPCVPFRPGSCDRKLFPLSVQWCFNLHQTFHLPPACLGIESDLGRLIITSARFPALYVVLTFRSILAFPLSWCIVLWLPDINPFLLLGLRSASCALSPFNLVPKPFLLPGSFTYRYLSENLASLLILVPFVLVPMSHSQPFVILPSLPGPLLVESSLSVMCCPPPHCPNWYVFASFVLLLPNFLLFFFFNNFCFPFFPPRELVPYYSSP